MMIIFTPEDTITCEKCDGTGYIPVDVYVSDGEVGKIVSNKEFECGVCGGEGFLFLGFALDEDEEDSED